ncbi:MAG: PQQ-like beta-propeller repeat protein [Planctomycetes bacterium]|nr:PQQ-like beta-propeller repeat protein [Planctomycetota bacterium]
MYMRIRCLAVTMALVTLSSFNADAADVVLDSPKLADSWPKGGPPVLWKSDPVPGYYGGGCGNLVVADGKVYLYAAWKQPVGGGSDYKLLTAEALANAGWLPDLPEELAKKIEEAWASPNRPSSVGWPWLKFNDAKTREKELDEFLAKKPELNKFIKDFIATLPPADASKYGDYIKKRLCIDKPTSVEEGGFTWAQLVKLSKMQDTAHPTLTAWAGTIGSVRSAGRGNLWHHFGISPWVGAWWHHSYALFDTLVCLDAATGKTLWKKDFPVDEETLAKLRALDAGRELGVCATPSVWNGKCYFTGAMGLYCLSAKDGALVWKVAREPLHPSVLVSNGVVYHCGSAYNAENGALLWKTPLWKGILAWEKGGDNSSPTLWVAGGRPYVIASNGIDVLCGLDLATGNTAWTQKYDGGYHSVMRWAVNGDVLTTVGQYKITPAGVEALPRLNKCLEGTNMNCSGHTFYQGHLYEYVTGMETQPSKTTGLCCFDLKTGELNWIEKNCGGPCIAADGKIFTVKEDNYVLGNYTLFMLKMTPEKYTPLGSFALTMCAFSNPTFATGRLFVRREDGVVCYNLQ